MSDFSQGVPRNNVILPSSVGMLDSLIGHFSAGSAASSDLEPRVVADLRQQLAKGKYFGRDMGELWRMLIQVLAKAGGVPGSGGEGFRLLNMACGRCEEAAVLSAFFSRTSTNTRQFALDLRAEEIDKAKRRYAATEAVFKKAGLPGICSSDGDSIEFVADDATRLIKYGQIPSEYEVVFIRHQNLWHDKGVWRRIYEFALSRLAAPDGILIITSYFDREHHLALEVLRELGGVIVTTERNMNSRELDSPGKSVDRHVAAIRQSA